MLKKWLNWEFWPSYMFYIPNLPYAFYLALKARSFVFFSAANPSIKHSGNGTESKFDTLKLIPTNYAPTSVLIKKHTNFSAVKSILASNNLNFPIIAKPDVGYRGLLVEKINSELQLKSYLDKYNTIAIILQEFIDLPKECGIFYHRIPTEENGHITSITLKEYLSVTGNGTSSLEQLVLENPRVSKHYNLVKSLYPNELDRIIEKDKKLILNFIGNHCKGSTFLDGNHLIDDSLERAIDKLLKKIPNIFYGRIDLKYTSFEELKKLENFKIIEINGIISEPTHIYDPYRSNYFKALKEIRKHWKILFKVATTNNRVNKVNYDSPKSFIRSLRKLKSYTQEIDLIAANQNR